jgi:molybdopterin molybdotransferase
MPEFLLLSPPLDAFHTFFLALHDKEPTQEEIKKSDSLGGVLCEVVTAPHPLPEFPRSTVDGYAVRARDTFGASDSIPGYLNMVGEDPMGSPPAFSISPDTCTLIHTGGMLPDGADAVVMLEKTQNII